MKLGLMRDMLNQSIFNFNWREKRGGKGVLEECQ